MAYDYEWPYVNSDKYNADWLLNKMKEIESEWDTFQALNTIKYANPINWNVSSVYEKNTLVLGPDGNSYLSTQFVPAGISYTNSDYWQKVADFNAQLKDVSDTLISFGRILASYGIVIPENAQLKRVGTSQYPTYGSAVNSISPGDFTIILLPPGDINVRDFWPTGDTPILSNTYLVGLGNTRQKTRLICNLSSPDMIYSTLNVQDNFGAYNISILASQCRYAIHDDFGTPGFYTRFFDSCYIQGASGLNHVIGGGVFGNANVIFRNCEIYSVNNLDAIFYHDKAGGEGSATITFDGCRVVATGSVVIPTFRFSKSTQNEIKINFRSCEVVGVAIESTLENGNLFISSDCDIPVFYTYDYTKMSCPGICRVQMAGQTDVGKAVSIINTPTTLAIQNGYNNAYLGVCIGKYATGSPVILKRGHWCTATMLGLTSPTETSKIFSADDGTLSLNSGLHEIGFVTQIGIAYLY